jgi:Flp pilus assembly protein TadG
MRRPFASVRTATRQFAADQSAAAVLEFAILGPLFIVLIFGVIIFGFALYTMSNVNYVAERVGRLLQLNPGMSAAEVSEAIFAELPQLDADNLDVAVEMDSDGAYDFARATVSYEFTVEMPLLGSYPIAYSTTVNVPRS